MGTLFECHWLVPCSRCMKKNFVTSKWSQFWRASRNFCGGSRHYLWYFGAWCWRPPCNSETWLFFLLLARTLLLDILIVVWLSTSSPGCNHRCSNCGTFAPSLTFSSKLLRKEMGIHVEMESEDRAWTCLICGGLHGFLAMKSVRHAIMLSCLLLAFFYVMLCSQSITHQIDGSQYWQAILTSHQFVHSFPTRRPCLSRSLLNGFMNVVRTSPSGIAKRRNLVLKPWRVGCKTWNRRFCMVFNHF